MSVLFLLGGCGGSRGCHKILRCLWLSTVSPLSSTSAQETPLSFTVRRAQSVDFYVGFGDGMDPRHPQGLQQQDRLQTSAWPPVAVQTTDINTAPSWNSDCEHYHGPWRQQKPWASARPLASTQAMDTNMSPVGAWIMDFSMASGDCTDCGHQHGLRW